MTLSLEIAEVLNLVTLPLREPLSRQSIGSKSPVVSRISVFQIPLRALVAVVSLLQSNRRLILRFNHSLLH